MLIKRKYTREMLEPIVKNNASVAGVMRDLGLKAQQGGSHTHLSRVIKKFGLDTSHFTGRGSNRGAHHKGGPTKKSPKEILILRQEGRRQKAYQLRRALIEIGRPYGCDLCSAQPTWQNRPLTLEIEHKNGNFLDDQAYNLILLCPNCHSQTKGHRGSKGYTDVISTARYYREMRKKKRGSGGKADALRLGRSGETRGGSNPFCPTK